MLSKLRRRWLGIAICTLLGFAFALTFGARLDHWLTMLLTCLFLSVLIQGVIRP